MRRVFLPLALSAVLAGLIATGSVRSAEAPPELGTDLMQAIEDSNKSLSSNISLKDAKASAADAKDINQAFIQVEAYFAARPDAHDAVELARRTRELTDQIAQQVGSAHFDAAADSATALSRTCRTCHTFYKKS